MKYIFNPSILWVLLLCSMVSVAQNVEMKVQQGPNIDVMVTVGSAQLDLSTFEPDLEQALHNKGLPLGKLRVEAFQRSTISSDQADASEIFNSWRKMNYNGTEPPVHNSYNGNYFSFNSATNRITADYVSRHNGYGYAMYDPSGDLSDGTISATFGLDGAPGAHAEVGFIFRKVDNRNFYAYIIDNHTACGNLMNYANGDGYPAEAILRVVNGVTSVLAVNSNSGRSGSAPKGWNANRSDMFSAYYNGQVIDFKIELNGENIKVTRKGGGVNAGTNWIEAFNFDDNTHASGSYGFYVHEQSGAYFKDIAFTKLSLRAFKDVLREPQWRNSALRFNVNLDNLEVADFELDSDLSEILMRTINEDIHYIGWGVDGNKGQFERFVSQNNTKGTFVNRSNGSYSSWVDQIAQYIYEQYQFGTIQDGNYFIAGTSVEIDVTPSQLKTNTANASYPSGRWNITHDETTFSNNSGKVSWNGLFLEDVPEFYEKTGKYTFSFENMPTAPTTLYFHRRPVAGFTYSPGSGGLNNTSYDLDGGATNGIALSEWKWKSVDAQEVNNWTDGQFNITSVPNGQYLIMLRVRDHQGTWSKPASIYVEKSGAVAGSDDLPIAQFNILPDVLTTYSGAMAITIDNNSSDPYGRTLSNHEWIVKKRIYDNDGNPVDTQIHNSGTPLTDFSPYTNESADFIIQLRTQTNTGVWSLPFYRTLTIIDDDTPPTINATPANGSITTDDTVQLTFADESAGSGFDVQKYVLLQNATPPANDDVRWSSWSNSQSKTVSFSSGGNGWYIHTRAKDNAGNEGATSFGPFTLTLIVSAEDDLALTNEDTASDPIDILFNDKYDKSNTPTVTISVQGTKGTAIVESDNTIIYTPFENQIGTDVVIYELDDNGVKATAEITISIQAQDDLPVAVEDTFELDENATLNEDVATNDIEVDGDVRTYHLVDSPSHASSFTFNSDGTFTYVHNGDEVATDSFTYRFEDAYSFSNTVTVTFNITLLNDAPEGGDISLDVVQDAPYSFSSNDFTFTDVDADDSFNGIQVISLPAKGTLSYNDLPVSPGQMIDDVTKLVFTTAAGEFGGDYSGFAFKVKDLSDVVSASDYTIAIAALEDLDGDGIPDINDPDIDGDGTPNDEDAFPRDPAEDTDTDGDGIGNNADDDDDNDGTPDSEDAFPLDPTEDTDTDGDGIGDNTDPDIDGDGTPNDEDAFPYDPTEDTDTDGDGIGDNSDPDIDGDGTPNDEDAFPYDPTEDTDTDGDGIGDNSDPDIDGDGTPNDQDDFPYDPTEDTDTDGDGIGDNTDPDIDGDGTPNDQDAFPYDPTEDTDTNGDGIGDNSDPDIDGDGTPNDQDDFPYDPTEDTDTDGDGIGDNTDPDIDGDGTPNDEDAFPYDPKEDTDTDGDGIGDNTDPDIDGDGTPNDQDAFPYDPTEDTDTDGDGIGDNTDPDIDGDGTPNDEDAFPYDPTEDTDTDGDGIGDNTDPDIDGDGTPNDEDAFPYDPAEDTDTDGDGIGDNTDPDIDGDGTPNDEDAFPYDPTEDTDTDGDGIGDNTDPDIDGDGTPNDEDAFPLDPTEDTDTDGDGIGDNSALDIDGDGTPNDEDAFPYDPTEDTDTDGDGIGDNSDPDIDGDGTPNDEDAFPYDPTEDTDTDGNGIGDNTDPDIDGDGTPNDEDAFPYDPTEDTDTDGDGIGDNADTDDDNDGLPDDEDYFPTNDRPTLIPAEAFTPNGDGINDYWIIPGIENYPNALVTVYNRWGHEVFASKGYRNNWDATYKSNRSKLPSGSYLYVINMGDGSAPIKGWLFINY